MSMREPNSGPAEWARLYHHGTVTGGGGAPSTFSHAVASMSESTVVTTTGTSPTVTGGVPQPGIEGRVARPARRRSRASRRAPTTLLNTDTANFRAMVQQFTGVPSAPYAPGLNVPNAPIVNFNVNFSDQIRQASTVVPYGSHIQYPQRQYQQSLQSYQPSEYQSTLRMGNNPSENFLQGFNNPRTSLEVVDGLLFDGISEQMGSRPAASTHEDGSDGYYL